MTAEQIARLMQKVNDIFGKDAFERLEAELSDDEQEQFGALLADGYIDLHHDAMTGFTAITDGGWTSEGFSR